MPVAAGMVPVAPRTAGRAAVDVTTQGLGATLLNRVQRRLLAGQQLVTVLRAIGRAVLAYNLTKRGHGSPAVRRSSAVAAVCSACWVRWV
jgi:hypothetical protein